MPENNDSTLFRIIFAVGILLLLIATLSTPSYVSEPIPEDSSWSEFATQFTSFPTFNDPFGPSSFTFFPAQDATEAPLNVRGVGATEPGFCDADESPVDNDWWGCLTTNDGPNTYVTTGFVGSDMVSVYLEAFPEALRPLRLITVTVDYECKGNGSGVIWDFSDQATPLTIELSTASAEDPIEACETTGASNQYPYSNHTSVINVETSGIFMSDFFAEGAEAFGRPGGPIGESDLIQISYVRVTVTYAPSSDCSSADSLAYIGCILTVLFFFGVDIFAWVVNVGLFFGSIIFWFIALIGSFVSLFGGFFSISDVPLIQGFITIFFVGCIAYVAIYFLKIARGSGTTG